jgi:hypothetical protein
MADDRIIVKFGGSIGNLPAASMARGRRRAVYRRAIGVEQEARQSRVVR